MLQLYQGQKEEVDAVYGVGTMEYQVQEVKSSVEFCKMFMFGKCKVIVGQEPEVGWHMSISRRTRYPSWDEIREARYTFIPDDITMVMVFPPADEYINVHPNCFHLYQEGGVVK